MERPVVRPHLDNYLANYLDTRGRVSVYPSKLKNKLLVLRHLALKLEEGRRYTEREVNEILKENHTFGDWALLRRDMFEAGLLQRNRDGSCYWRAQAE